MVINRIERRMLMLALVAAFVAGGGAVAAARDDTSLDAIAARLETHADTAGLKAVSKPIVGSETVEQSVAGSLGRVQALFLDLATSEPNLVVDAIQFNRASDAMRARGASLAVSYTVRYVPRVDDEVRRAQWAVPVLLKGLLGGTVAGGDLLILDGSLKGGTLQIEGRSRNHNAAKSIEQQLNAGPSNLVKSVEVEDRKPRPNEMSVQTRVPQGRVTVYGFLITAHYDPTGVPLDVLKREAYT